ncbi:MAG: hypothetical protein NTW82_08175 [Bacteroidia bacterium]|nr:hypothetical protein [Bacteroidia bacterium]
MEKKVFYLESKENPGLAKIFHIVLGIACIVIAIYWVIFNIQSIKTDGTLWITILFLVLFGVYQVLDGAGKTRKYISTEPGKLILKQHSVLPVVKIKSEDIEKIEIFPLSVSFKIRNRNKIVFRFGLSYIEIIDPVKNEIAGFAGLNHISYEIKVEEL